MILSEAGASWLRFPSIHVFDQIIDDRTSAGHDGHSGANISRIILSGNFNECMAVENLQDALAEHIKAHRRH